MNILAELIGKEKREWLEKKYLQFILPIIYTGLGIFISHSWWEGFQETGENSVSQIVLIILLMMGIWSSIKKDCIFLKFLTGRRGYINLFTFIKTHGIIIIDEETRIIYVNRPICKLLERKKEDIIGEKLDGIYSHK